MSGEAKEKSTTGKLETTASSWNADNRAGFELLACLRPSLDPDPFEHGSAGIESHHSRSALTTKEVLKRPPDSIRKINVFASHSTNSTDKVAEGMPLDIPDKPGADPQAKLPVEIKGDIPLMDSRDEGANSSMPSPTAGDLPDDYRERIMRVLGPESNTLAGVIPYKPGSILKIYVNCKDKKHSQQAIRNALSTDWTIVINDASQCPKLELAHDDCTSCGDGIFTVVLGQGNGLGKFKFLNSARLSLFLRSTEVFQRRGLAQVNSFYALTVHHLFCSLYKEYLGSSPDKDQIIGKLSETSRKEIYRNFCVEVNTNISQNRLRIHLQQGEHIILVTKVCCGDFCLPADSMSTDAVLLELDRSDIYDFLGKDGDFSTLNSVIHVGNDQLHYLNGIRELNTPDEIEKFCRDESRSMDFAMGNVPMSRVIRKYDPWLRELVQRKRKAASPYLNYLPAIWSVPKELYSKQVKGLSGSTLRMKTPEGSTFGVGILHGNVNDDMNGIPATYCMFFSLSYQLKFLESIQRETVTESIDFLCQLPPEPESPKPDSAATNTIPNAIPKGEDGEK